MIINENDLDLDEDVSLYQGRPFTGTTQLFHANGTIKRETPYSEGFEQGPCREWYDNGQLRHEWHAVRGVADGKVCDWYENGKVKSVGIYKMGVELLYDEWSDEGRLIAHREIDRQSALWRYVNGTDSGSGFGAV